MNSSSPLLPNHGETGPSLSAVCQEPPWQLFGMHILCDMESILSRSGGVPNRVNRKVGGLEMHSSIDDMQGEVFACSVALHPSSTLVSGLSSETQPF